MNEALENARGKVKAFAKENGILIKTPEIDYSLDTDRDGMVELLVVLLDNAIKYSPENSAIEVHSRKSDSFIVIEVKDKGIGIDSNDMTHIFDRFYRASESRSKTTVSRYGLGLSIAKKIVGANNGAISIESTQGKGSAFAVRLPFKKSRGQQCNVFTYSLSRYFLSNLCSSLFIFFFSLY